MRKTLLVAAGLLALAGCHPKPGGLEVGKAWARETAPGQSVAAAYLSIINGGGDDRLTGVDVVAPAGARASVHSSSMDGGVMRMRAEANGLPVPAGTTTLAPGGAHIMIEGLRAPLTAGTRLRLSLHFQRAGTREVGVPVLPAGSEGPNP